MRLDLYRPSWFAGGEEPDVDAINAVLHGSWAEAAQRYAADRSAKLGAGRRPPIGVQPSLNRVIDERFARAGWLGSSGRFIGVDVWLRITFRHQMSLGSDIVDAMKVTARRSASVAIIAAAPNEFLRVVSPNDFNALTSFEKLSTEFRDLEGVVSSPLLLGRLTPVSVLPNATASIVFGPRPREG